MVAAVLSRAGGRIPGLVGVEAGATRFAAWAARSGASALLLIPPETSDLAAVVACCRDMAMAAGLPLVLLDHPRSSGWLET